MVAALLAAACVAQGVDKLATVDLEAAVRSHPKTEGNKQTLRNTQKEYEEQRDALKTKVGRLQENFVKANEQANNSALNEKARETQKGIAREILTELRKEEEGLRQLISRLQRSLNETELLLFEGTMKDINAKVEEIAKEKGLSLVIDKSAVRAGAPVPVVLWSIPTLDITEDLVKRIGGTLKPASSED
jgi:Skp family chaperone for outer membrane proteins